MFNNLGEAYLSLQNYEQALSHFQQALSTAKTLNDNPSHLRLLNSVGTTQVCLSHPQQARLTYEKAILLAQSLKDTQAEEKARYNLSLIIQRLPHTEPEAQMLDEVDP